MDALGVSLAPCQRESSCRQRLPRLRVRRFGRGCAAASKLPRRHPYGCWSIRGGRIGVGGRATLREAKVSCCARILVPVDWSCWCGIRRGMYSRLTGMMPTNGLSYWRDGWRCATAMRKKFWSRAGTRTCRRGEYSGFPVSRGAAVFFMSPGTESRGRIQQPRRPKPAQISEDYPRSSESTACGAELACAMAAIEPAAALEPWSGWPLRRPRRYRGCAIRRPRS
jgi:hypothetical protein